MGGGRERSWPGQKVKASSTHPSPPFWPQPRPSRSRRTEGQRDRAGQLPGSRWAARNARLAAETRGDKVLTGGANGSHRPPPRRDTQTRTRPDRQTDSASGGRGPGLPRGGGSDEGPGGGERALHPTARSGGRRPGRGEGSPGAPSPRTRRAGAAPPPRLPVGLSVGLRVSAPRGRPAPLPAGHPTFSAAPRRAPGAAWASASSGRAPAQSPGVRGPMALDRPRSRPPPPPPVRRRPPLFSRCHSALSPALRSAPCPAALASGPGPENPAAGRPGIRCHPPRLPPWVSVPLPVSSVPVRVSPSLPAGSLSSPCRPPSVSPASLRLCPVSPARLYLSSSRSPSVLLCLSLPPTLGAAPAVSDPGPRLRRVPGSPGSPSSRRPRRAENSQLAARRPALRDFRPSSHVTRAPVRRPRAPPAPGPRAARGAPPGPFPAAQRVFKPARVGRTRGAGPGAGGCGAPLLPRILPGFSSSLQERSSQNPFRGSAPGFSSPQGPAGWVPLGREGGGWERVCPGFGGSRPLCSVIAFPS